MLRRSALLLPLLVLVVSCSANAPAPAPEQPAPPAPPVVAAAGSSAYVSGVSFLRREPSDAQRVKGPTGRDVANVLATLQRGEKVTVVEEAARVVGKDEWAHVRSSDDRDGWLKRTALLEGEGVAEATVLVPADVFDRPDLLAANARRKIEPATLLLVVKTRPPFSEVNVSSGPNAWVLTDRLAMGEAEVSIAKLAEKARWLVRAGKPEDARGIVALAEQRYPGAPLVEAILAELAAATEPADGAVVVPVSGELPADGGGGR
jgi:hypothetical protein